MQKRSHNRDLLWKDRKHFMWFPLSFTKYSVSNECLFISKGFFNTVQDQTLLYRIIDIQMRRTLVQRMFGTGTIILVTKADMDHEIKLENIRHPQVVNDLLSDAIEDIRRRKNVVGKEFYSANAGIHPLDVEEMHNDFDHICERD